MSQMARFQEALCRLAIFHEGFAKAGFELGPGQGSALDAKAAALLHSLARNHALVDGNKRLALAAVIAFYGVNGRRLTLTDDEAYEFIIAVAAGHLDSVEDITARLKKATEARPGPSPGSGRRG